MTTATTPVLPGRSPGGQRLLHRAQRGSLRTAAAVILLFCSVAAAAQEKDLVDQAQEPSYVYPPDDPADGVWLRDAGGRFFVARISKEVEGLNFKRLDGDRLRFQLGLILPLVGEDETHVFVRVPGLPEPASADPENGADTDTDPGSGEIPAAGGVAAEPAPSERLTGGLARGEVDLGATAFDRGLPRSGMWRNDADLVDLDGDGRLDLVHGPVRKGRGSLHAYRNEGGGDWSRWPLRYTGGALDYGAVRMRDLDADGRLDLAIAMHLLGTTVAYGREDGVLEERPDGFDRPDFDAPNSPFGKRAPWSSRALELFDVDGDGDLDVIALGEGMESIQTVTRADESAVTSEGVSVYLNGGDGPWTPLRFVDLPIGGSGLAFGELDGDPGPEAAVAWISSGDDRVILDLDASGEGLAITARELPSLTGIDGGRSGVTTAVAVGQVRPASAQDEIVIGRILRAGDEARTLLELHERGADGEWTAETITTLPGAERILSIGLGDVNDDGRTDLAVGSGRSRLQVFVAREDGSFGVGTLNEPPAENTQCSIYWVKLADLDGEPGDEVIAGFAGESTIVPLIGPAPGCPDQGSIRSWKLAVGD